MLKKVSLLLILLIFFLLPNLSFARTTPEDILNAKKDVYNQKVKNYSLQNKQKLEFANSKIAEFNKQKTDELEFLMTRQGDLLNEYIRRTGFTPSYETDGIHRLDKPVDNALYWLTFAHEAVAYQAAKVYVFDLTSEPNIKGDINSQVNILQSDLNGLRVKVIKSQNIISALVAK